MTTNDLQASFDGQMKRSQLSCILYSFVHRSADAHEKEHAFDVAFLHGNVHKTEPFVIDLNQTVLKKSFYKCIRSRLMRGIGISAQNHVGGVVVLHGHGSGKRSAPVFVLQPRINAGMTHEKL